MDYYVDGVLKYTWDSVNRTFTEYDSAGVPVVQRPYTPEENAQADLIAAAETEENNRKSIEQALAESLVLLQAIIDTPNADMTASAWKGYVKDLARVQRRLIRLVIRRFDGAA